MKKIRTEIEINATAERVWQVLTDFTAFPDWNPFIQQVKGQVEVGEQLEVFLQPPDGRGMTFKPKVVTAEPNREFRWRGRLWIPGLFDGEHAFIIEPLGENRVRFEQGEAFGGILVPLLAFMGLFIKTEQGFQEMNQALKAPAEAR
ncbi:MAG: SRPBCC family protein, partial [Dehalococcoidia bacterium]